MHRLEEIKGKVLIATGGTGGHIYPSISLGQELKKANINYFFAGAKLSENRYFSENEPFIDIESGSGLKQSYKILKGIWQAYKLLKKLEVKVVVGFGSYYTFPILAAAILNRIPLILFAADQVPGKVIKWFSPFAQVTALQFPEAKNFLKGASIQTKMPLREGFKREKKSKDKGLKYYSFQEDKPVCLVFGGSQGANSLNQIAPDAFSQHFIQSSKSLNIIHIAGKDEHVKSLEESYRSKNLSAVVKPYETRMDLAWSAADFALIRSGAGAIAEAIEFQVYALAVPYPFAKDDHQNKNADYLVKCGAGLKLEEKNMTVQSLSHSLSELLKMNHPYPVHASPEVTLLDLVKQHL